MVTIAETATLVKQEEGLKLEKNSRGYTWEIKLIGPVDYNLIQRMEEINKNLLSKFNIKEDKHDKT